MPVMEPEIVESDPSTGVVSYNVTDSEIAALRERFAGLTAETKEGYKACQTGIAECRDLRVAVEKRRVVLKADALAWGRKVDAEAKRITVALESIEEPLKVAKKLIDDEAERKKREIAEAAQRKIDEENRIAREAEEARLRAEQEKLAEERRLFEAERAKIEEEQRIEREKLDAERRVAEEAAKIEREKIAAQERAIRAEQERLERIEFERQAKIQAEKDAAEKVERERIAEQNRIAAEKAEADRVAAMKPDVEKVHAFSAVLAAIEFPQVSSTKAAKALSDARIKIEAVAASLAKFSA